MVKTFRKKPVVADLINAIQYTGELAPVKKFMGIRDANFDEQTRDLILPSLEVAKVGDWIVKGSNGEFYKKTNAQLLNDYEEVVG